MEEGLGLDMSVAIVGRSNFRNHYSQTCKTTSASLSRDVAPCIPSPPGRVIVGGPL